MHAAYRLFRRANGVYYIEDIVTRRQTSLATRDDGEAAQLLAARNQAVAQPLLNAAMARTYMSASDPELCTRVWKEVADLIASGYQGATLARWQKFIRSSPLASFLSLTLVGTTSKQMMAVLCHERAGVSTNIYLRILHNRAFDMGWLLTPALARKAWPKVKYGQRKAITLKEHEAILAVTQHPEYRLYFELLWETGGSQSDVACLTMDDIDWVASRLYYDRKKLESQGKGNASLALGGRLKSLLLRCEEAGREVECSEIPGSPRWLFPHLRTLEEDDRASFFRKMRLRVKLPKGLSLHSYRYAWAERANAAGMPEREAMAHLGHGSKAIHRAYSRKADVVTLPLEYYEAEKDRKLLLLASTAKTISPPP